MKKYIIIVSIAVGYLLIAILGSKLTSGKPYIVINPRIRWTYQSKKWINLEPSRKALGKLNFYDIATDKKIGTYSVINDTELKVNYGKKYETVDKEEDIFALSGDIVPVKYGLTRVTDDVEIKYVLAGAKLKLDGIINLKKVSIDLNGDNALETLYTINNYEYFEDEIKEYYSGVYLYDGKNFEKIVSQSDKNSLTSFYNIYAIIDFKKDKKYEIIISNAGLSRDFDSEEYSMYGLEDGKYVELISIK